ncbi:MAG: hypothetical protein ACKVOU_03670 [Cytophagales bacterium]
MCKKNIIGTTRQLLLKITKGTDLDLNSLSPNPIVSFKLYNPVAMPDVFLYQQQFLLVADTYFEVNNSNYLCTDIIKIKFDNVQDIGELWLIATVLVSQM